MDREAFLSAAAATSASILSAGYDANSIREIKAKERVMTLEFQQLSIQEREKVYFDLHGVSQGPEETEDLIRESLDLYHGYVHAMTQDTSDPRSKSYALALKQDEDFVQGKWLGLLFLRANLFDAEKAAEALLCHLYLQHTMIGEHAIARVMRQSDMSQEDLDVLNTGILQLLPQRDSSGRAVVVVAIQYMTKDHTDNYRHFMNAMSYLLWKAATDTESQKRGLVLIHYNIGPFKPEICNPNIISHIAQVLPASPLRFVGVHVCYSDSLFAPLFNLGKALSSRSNRLRTKFHSSTSHVEMQYALMTFGLPVQTSWPVDANGNLCQVDRHAAWLSAVANLEEKQDVHKDSDEDGFILLPSRFDVLAGRAHVGHAGNLRLKFFIEESMSEYENRPKSVKTNIIAKVVEGIQSLGGNFLEAYCGVWKIQSYEKANRRVSSLFRTSQRATKNKNNSRSSGPSEGNDQDAST